MRRWSADGESAVKPRDSKKMEWPSKTSRPTTTSPNDFFGLFQDPTRTYSSAYFERDDMTLEEAQMAKIDLALGKLGLQPGMTLLDVGCGWGSLMQRAVEKHDVNVIGLTLSKNQREVCASKSWTSIDTERSRRSDVDGWEAVRPARRPHRQHRGDRGVPKGAIRSRFSTCAPASCPAMAGWFSGDHGSPLEAVAGDGHPDHDDRLAVHALHRQGDLPRRIGAVRRGHHRILSTEAGFSVAEQRDLTEHYVRTLDTWAKSLKAAREEAIAVTSQEVYERYMKYLIGCRDFFNRNISYFGQFTLVK